MTTSSPTTGYGRPGTGDHPGEGDSTSDRLRAIALRVFLASIAINALLGIWALLAGDFGQTEGKVLATSLLLSAAILSVLVNGAPLQRRVLWPVPMVAAVTGVTSILGFVVLMWAEVDDEVPIKLAVSGLVVAVAATLVGLLALLPLRAAHVPVQYVHIVLTALLTATILWGIWGEIDTSWYGRVVGVQSVLVAALTLAIPVLWRFGGRTGPPASAVGGPPVAIVGDLLSALSASSAVSASSPMAAGLIPVDASALLGSAIARLVDDGLRSVVVEDSSRLVGVLSDHDVLRAIRSGADPEQTTVAEAMSTGIVTLPDGATVDEAARLMIDRKIDQLVVTGERGGVLSVHDILAAVTAEPVGSTSPRGGTVG